MTNTERRTATASHTLMTFSEWKVLVAAELSRMTYTIEGERIDGEQYIRDTGDDCWREMFDDGMSPNEAANEEMIAGHDCG